MIGWCHLRLIIFHKKLKNCSSCKGRSNFWNIFNNSWENATYVCTALWSWSFLGCIRRWLRPRNFLGHSQRRLRLQLWVTKHIFNKCSYRPLKIYFNMLSNCENTTSQHYVMYEAGAVFFPAPGPAKKCQGAGSGSTTLCVHLNY